MAVAALVTDGERVLLVRRAVIPQVGLWALPAGYMDCDESPEQAVAREVQEETGIRISSPSFLRIAPLAGWKERRGVLLMFAGRPESGTLAPDDDASEAAWFSADQIPWSLLAFESTTQSLREWVASLSVTVATG